MKILSQTIKLYILTGLCCIAFSLPALANCSSACDIYKQDIYPKKAFELCDDYCNDEECTDPCNKNKERCVSLLRKFHKLDIGDPICFTEQHAYITNFNNSTISLCTITADGSFDTCSDASTNAQFINTQLDHPVQLALNKDQNTAYFTNYGNNGFPSISKCSINTAGQLDTCTDSGVGAVFIKPFGIVFNAAENTAYVTNNEGPKPVSICTIVNGSFTSCVDSDNDDIGGRPVGIILNGDESIAYVANDTGGLVLKCTSGLFATCTATGSGFGTPIGLVSNGKIVYITDHSDNTVRKCVIDTVPGPTLGNLINCSDSGVGAVFAFPLGITLNKTADTAYVANLTTNTVSKCSIDNNQNSPTFGAFTSCVDSGVGAAFNGPFWVTLAH